jgi:hypothetical protein
MKSKICMSGLIGQLFSAVPDVYNNHVSSMNGIEDEIISKGELTDVLTEFRRGRVSLRRICNALTSFPDFLNERDCPRRIIETDVVSDGFKVALCFIREDTGHEVTACPCISFPGD